MTHPDRHSLRDLLDEDPIARTRIAEHEATPSAMMLPSKQGEGGPASFTFLNALIAPPLGGSEGGR